MIVDTSVLLAFFDRNEPAHDRVVSLIEEAAGPFVVSPYVVAELDYLVLSRHGAAAERAVLDELTSGAWELARLSLSDVKAAVELIGRLPDQRIGIADASNIVLADLYRTDVIATLDRRHFSVLRLADGRAPVVVPA